MVAYRERQNLCRPQRLKPNAALPFSHKPAILPMRTHQIQFCSEYIAPLNQPSQLWLLLRDPSGGHPQYNIV